MSENKNFFRAAAEDFKKVPGSPIAYWLSNYVRNAFALPKLLDVAAPRTGFTTGDNEIFLRLWQEVPLAKIGQKWFYLNKGGRFRKWFGNNEYVVDWENDGEQIKASPNSTIRNPECYFKEGVTWSKISTTKISGRYSPSSHIFDAVGLECFSLGGDLPNTMRILSIFNANTSSIFLNILNPTLSFSTGPVGNLPIPGSLPHRIEDIAERCLSIARADWNSYEISWDFESNPLVEIRQNLENPADSTLNSLYSNNREKWVADCEEMRRLETENNSIFIDAYGLQDELTPEVPWDEITLTCNPWYRYNAKCGMRNEELGGALPKDTELEKRLMADTVKELISYAVGCMMGRYSLDKPGLILADQGSTITDYNEKVGNASFSPDEDGIIPVLDNDWFADDIVTRFKEFIKVAFGEEHFFENMTWIEDALGKDIRSYFTKDFYKDHLQRYQNRPIYWLFQSPKGAFRALVYMHRYKPDMVGGVLGYLRSLQTKVENQLNVAMQIGTDESKSASERVRANKDAVKYAKAKKELDEYERNVLYPLSTERIEIDLDDGVKVNYRKFGTALRKVTALEGKGE